ncbi:hypothetical protein RNZ50_12555 [Paracoccaceae bacterium Fryx2]|nr:hypothetical protein [Paracoccaceae bacterium Fryx2]
MDFSRIISMITNIFVRKAVNIGIRKGVDLVSRGKTAPKPGVKLTSAEALQANKARETAKRARQAARITRRLGR